MGVPYCEVIERMKLYGKLKNNSAIARVLGVTPQALSNYKKRNSLPSKLVLKFASTYELFVDHLLLGYGPIYKTEPNREKNSEAFMDNSFSQQEIEYIGKLLIIFRKQNQCKILNAMKHMIDALYQSSEPISENIESIIKEKSAF